MPATQSSVNSDVAPFQTWWDSEGMKKAHVIAKAFLPQEADDVVQEVGTILYLQYDSGKLLDDLVKMLKTVTTNRCIDHIRDNERRAQVVVTGQEGNTEAIIDRMSDKRSISDPQQRTVDIDFSRSVDAIIQERIQDGKLKPEDVKIWKLVRQEGMKPEEIQSDFHPTSSSVSHALKRVDVLLWSHYCPDRLAQQAFTSYWVGLRPHFVSQVVSAMQVYKQGDVPPPSLPQFIALTLRRRNGTAFLDAGFQARTQSIAQTLSSMCLDLDRFDTSFMQPASLTQIAQARRLMEEARRLFENDQEEEANLKKAKAIRHREGILKALIEEQINND